MYIRFNRLALSCHRQAWYCPLPLTLHCQYTVPRALPLPRATCHSLLTLSVRPCLSPMHWDLDLIDCVTDLTTFSKAWHSGHSLLATHSCSHSFLATHSLWCRVTQWQWYSVVSKATPPSPCHMSESLFWGTRGGDILALYLVCVSARVASHFDGIACLIYLNRPPLDQFPPPLLSSATHGIP